MSPRHPPTHRNTHQRAGPGGADADEKVAWTGPVLRSCSVNGNELSLTFADELLGDDTIMVLQSTSNTFGWDLDGTVSQTRRLGSLIAAVDWPAC